jgi:AcrR family transcriptional regulator
VNRPRQQERIPVQPTHDRIRQAALQLFIRKGYEGTGIRDIAAAAGITVGSLYHYMRTKDDLLAEIVRGVLPAAVEAAERGLADAETVEDQLGTLVQLHVWLLGTRSMSAYIAEGELRFLRGEFRSDVLALRKRYERLWRDTIERGRHEGIFQVANANMASFAILGMCIEIAWWYSPDGPLTLPELGAMYVDFALGLLRAQRDGRPIRAADLTLPDPAPYFPWTDREEPAGRVYRGYEGKT